MKRLATLAAVLVAHLRWRHRSEHQQRPSGESIQRRGEHSMKLLAAVVLMLVFVAPASFGDDSGILDRQLIDAVERRDASAVEALLAAGADPNASKDLEPALHIAIWDRAVEIVEALLAAGADPNARRDGYPVLQFAVRAGNVEIVEALLAAGADVNAFSVWVPGCCQHRDTALHQAVKYWFVCGDDDDHCPERRTEIIQVLIAVGADVNARGKLGGFTPLMVADQWGFTEVRDILVRAGANSNPEPKPKNSGD